MIKKKNYDGVVVAVHYTPQGEIDWVRAFERRGFVFSDRMMLKRADLIDRLQAGKRFKTGVRKIYQGSDFDIADDIRLVERNGNAIVVAGQGSPERDTLGNLPII